MAGWWTLPSGPPRHSGLYKFSDRLCTGSRDPQHPLTNSSGLLSQALKATEKVAGEKLSGYEDPSSGLANPNSCFYLRSASGVFLHRLGCGGATNPNPALSGVYYYLWEVPFKVVRLTDGTYDGELAGKPFKATQMPAIGIGYQLWRPDDFRGKVVAGPGGTLDTTFGQVFTSAMVPGTVEVGIAVLLGIAAFATWVVLLRSRQRTKDPRRARLVVANEAWGHLARLAFSPALVPRAPVFASGLPEAPPAPADDEAPGPTTSAAWRDLVGQPAAPPAPAPSLLDGLKVAVRSLGRSRPRVGRSSPRGPRPSNF
jgi:hypothetical protein